MAMVRAERARQKDAGAQASSRAPKGAHERLRSAIGRVGRPIQDLFRPGVSDPADVEKWAGIPYIGAVVAAPAGLPRDRASTAVVQAPESRFAASLQGVRAQLQASRANQVIALTSAHSGDGKTTCSLALARQSALEGHRTVLVDCDLRRACSTAELPSPPRLGLIEVIEERCDLNEALARDLLSPLWVLPVTPDREAICRATVQDVFGKEQMAALIGALRRRFEYVFIDTPPVLELVDARRLAPLVDTFLFLARSRRMPRPAVKQAIEMLKAANAPLSGFVLTNPP